MIRVVGANPALDRVSTWPPVELGQVNRAMAVTVLAGGKGLNVCRAARTLGEAVAAYGFLGGLVGERIAELARTDGVEDRHTRIEAESRVCFIVVEPGRGRSTVLNEPGPGVTTAESERLVRHLREDCGPDDIVVLSGSLPDGLAPALAGEIVAVARDAGARTLVDIAGPSLVAAHREGPWMIKCNREELAALTAASGDHEALELHRRLPLVGLAREMLRVRDRGVAVVVVTLGEDGVLLADAGGIRHASVPRVEVVNATGSGDLLLAGLAVAAARGRSLPEAIALGAACGTAGATTLLPSLPAGFDPASYAPLIHIRPLDVGP
jgi:1-phosphofructokinase family hexose kinase